LATALQDRKLIKISPILRALNDAIRPSNCCAGSTKSPNLMQRIKMECLGWVKGFYVTVNTRIFDALCRPALFSSASPRLREPGHEDGFLS